MKAIADRSKLMVTSIIDNEVLSPYILMEDDPISHTVISGSNGALWVVQLTNIILFMMLG